MTKFMEKSYFLHEEHVQRHVSGGNRYKHAQTWLENDTVDAWRHKRLYDAVMPLILSCPDAVWLTVGDGRLGNDAHYLKEKGLRVLSTDITDDLLKEAQKKGYIDSCKSENAEALSFKNEEFDYVLCKEAYHHFPRPAIALYEMLRVAKKGVVLIEPNDPRIITNSKSALVRSIKSPLKRILRIKESSENSYEEVGNYVYTISVREMEKVALGINLRSLAFKYMNDVYIEGVEYEKIGQNGQLFKTVKKRLAYLDFFCKFGLMDFNMLVTIIFKGVPDNDQKDSLFKHGFSVLDLPVNPSVQNPAG
jgi:ubiquinone/menaquinone biosynthesis C-methylase UbiE